MLERKGDEPKKPKDDDQFTRNLPSDLLRLVLQYAPLTEARAIANDPDDNPLKTQMRDSALQWEARYKKHFPIQYNTFPNKKNINWHTEFEKTYQDTYKDLGDRERHLFSAIAESNLEELKRLKLTFNDLDLTNKNRFSLFEKAVSKRDQKVLDYIYELAQQYYSGSNSFFITPQKKDKHDRTLLFWAMMCHQSEDTIDLIFANGGNRHEKYYGDYWGLIHIAAQRGYAKVVTNLIEREPLLLNLESQGGDTALIKAAISGHENIVAYLLTKPDRNLDTAMRQGTDNPGRTALHWAANGGYTEIVVALCKAGANAALKAGPMQFMPIHLAAQKGHLGVVEALIEAHPELLNAEDAHGQTALMWAASHGHLAVAEYLLSQPGINFRSASRGFPDAAINGKTAADLANTNGHPTIVEAIRRAQAEQNREALMALAAYIDLHDRQLSHATRVSSHAGRPFSVRSSSGHPLHSIFSPKERLLAKAAKALQRAANDGGAPLSASEKKILTESEELAPIYKRLRF